jgi:hypothetical protein
MHLASPAKQNVALRSAGCNIVNFGDGRLDRYADSFTDLLLLILRARSNGWLRRRRRRLVSRQGFAPWVSFGSQFECILEEVAQILGIKHGFVRIGETVADIREIKILPFLSSDNFEPIQIVDALSINQPIESPPSYAGASPRDRLPRGIENGPRKLGTLRLV